MVIFENKAVVDACEVYTMHPRVPSYGYARVYIYTAWVSALLIRDNRFFLRPQMTDKQEKRSAFFDVRNHLLD